MSTLKHLMNMQGRYVVITGAAGFLGRVIADVLGEMGCNLILVDCSDEGIDALVQSLGEKWGGEYHFIQCNLESEAQRKKLISDITEISKTIDGLINNAAFVGDSDLAGWNAPFESQSIDAWRRAVEVNLTSAFDLSQGLISHLRKSGNGSIVNISSIYGEHGPDWRLYEDLQMSNPAAYSVSKAGLNQLTRWLATTTAPEVRVNAIAPGGIVRHQSQTFIDRYESKVPLARMATEDDFRGAIAYLSSDLSRYVTGQILYVDGGWGVW